MLNIYSFHGRCQQENWKICISGQPEIILCSFPSSEPRNQFSLAHFLSNHIAAVKTVSLFLFVPRTGR